MTNEFTWSCLEMIGCNDNLSITPCDPVLWGGLVCLIPTLCCFALSFCLPSGLLGVTRRARHLIRPRIWLHWEALDIFLIKISFLVFLLSFLSFFRLLSPSDFSSSASLFFLPFFLCHFLPSHPQLNHGRHRAFNTAFPVSFSENTW